MGVQRRYKGVEGICRRYGDIWKYKDDTREQRVSVEGYGDIWKYKDDTREQRVDVEGYGDIWEYKDDKREQRVDVEGYGDKWKCKDETRDGIGWDMLNGTGMVYMEIQGEYQ